MQPEPETSRQQLSPTLRGLLLLAGVIAVALGILGIFLPVLPTVPFLLLAAACFTRSSEKFYSWLIDHAHLGPIVQPYLDGAGLKQSTKLKAISLIWISIAFSVYLLGDRMWVQGVLVLIAIGVTVYLLRLPTLEGDSSRD
jgi:uncharacterized membrane protein YbaN (DUF454 family)